MGALGLAQKEVAAAAAGAVGSGSNRGVDGSAGSGTESTSTISRNVGSGGGSSYGNDNGVSEDDLSSDIVDQISAFVSHMSR